MSTAPLDIEKQEEAAVKAAFGAVNRRRLIDLYFSSYPATDVSAALAWKHVYRLLLWVDQASGLAHCYESDKSQPGKNWYARSLAFHDWVGRELEVDPGNLRGEIDWLFRRASADLAGEVAKSAPRVAAAADKQRQPYAGRGFPESEDDPAIIAVTKAALGVSVAEVPPESWRLLVKGIRQHFAQENKRKNLVGEGFEDVLAQVVARTCGLPQEAVLTRCLLQDIPGFQRAKTGEKPNKVDLAIVRPYMRSIITAKWSLRADREKQFAQEFDEYTNAEAHNQRFEYVFVTNEFDPARLMRACEKLVRNSQMFSHVVHISPAAVRATYGPKPEPTMKKVLGYMDSGRLISLGEWLTDLSGRAA